MRTMILSFSPRWYPDLSSGRKIYEHRKRFCNEEVIAYIYLGLPYRQIVAKVELGKKIDMNDWLEQYKDDSDAIERIEDFMLRSNYAMPIFSFQEIEPIDVRKMEKDLSHFRAPISYMFVDDKKEIFDYIIKHEKLNGELISHSFDDIKSKDICIC